LKAFFCGSHIDTITMTNLTRLHRAPFLALSISTVLFLGLAACSKQDATSAPSAAAAIAPADSYDALAKQGKGFTAGAMMSAQTVYVMFDPQCPHCGALWNASIPLQKKVKFVWVPVSLMNAKSTPQGAALLSSANPVEAMTAHETALLGGGSGMSAPSSMSPETEAAIKSNTLLFNSLGATSVPYIVAKDARSGKVVTNSGAMQTPALAAFLGVE
jgi:thiol:disulfide interchange protein DsbG